MTRGQEFVVLGSGFDTLPDQLVLAPSESYAQSSNVLYQYIPMTSKTDTKMVFTTETNHSYIGEVFFQFLATPKNAPRTLIEYDKIGNRDLGEIRLQDTNNYL